MKKLFILFLLTTVTFALFAQLKPYQPNPVLNRFVGTWVAQTGEKMTTITIRKVQESTLNSKIDFLEGYLSYKDNDDKPDESVTPVLTTGINYAKNGKVYQDKVFFNYYDKRKMKRGKLTITLSDTNSDKFTVRIAEDRDVKIITPSNPARKVEMGFTMPTGTTFYRKL